MAKISWSGYSIYEGPMSLGDQPFRLPAKPTSDDMVLAVITATEGGSWNAVNMYDSCICTVGLIQWCEAGQFSVSDMLGAVIANSPRGAEALAPLIAPMDRVGALFHRNAKNRWRFYFGQNEVADRAEQQRLFFLNANGKKGEWDPVSRAHANQWCEGLVKVFSQTDAIEAQKVFTTRRLNSWFTLEYGKKILASAPKTNVSAAFNAAFLSFAANNPSWADEHLKRAVESSAAPAWSLGWLIDCLRQWTWGPNVTIYPHRYNKIRPVLERLYGIDLPDLAGDLSGFLDTDDIQAILVKLGYDLGKTGPGANGVDGKWGNKSRAALTDFQSKNGLDPDGWPDPKTNDALMKAA